MSAQCLNAPVAEAQIERSRPRLSYTSVNCRKWNGFDQHYTGYQLLGYEWWTLLFVVAAIEKLWGELFRILEVILCLPCTVPACSFSCTFTTSSCDKCNMVNAFDCKVTMRVFERFNKVKVQVEGGMSPLVTICHRVSPSPASTFFLVGSRCQGPWDLHGQEADVV